MPFSAFRPRSPDEWEVEGFGYFHPVQVVVAESEQGRGVLGVIDGASPKGVESDDDVAKRKSFLRMIGYKRQ